MSEDLNILTGRNGAGKTSVLKLLWAIVSGNIIIALDEVNFTRAKVVTDHYECIVHKINKRTCRVEFLSEDEDVVLEDIDDDEGNIVENAEDAANERLIQFGSSLFFPTFRRIEGGFSISPSRANGINTRQSRARADLEESLVTLSRGLTHVITHPPCAGVGWLIRSWHAAGRA
ncbi:hypothetical protein ACFQS7_24805 [Dankookia sp. GCM10030260]|uniref:ATP-binding protein n=1 Tax=Dankookia sp. GCM10030260 TaxID=3273390 RepID=UPI003623F566